MRKDTGRADHPQLLEKNWQPIYSTLFENNFGVKYVGKEHADHLLTTLNRHYIISQYWEVTRYLGMNLDWDYEKREVYISILDYVVEALIRFQHNAPPPKKRKINQIHT